MMEEEAVKKALPSALFNKLQQKRQLEEVEAAGLEDLEKCPACSYATIIPDPAVKVLVCGNPECGKETCRECREESHTPLACNEVERDEEVRARNTLTNNQILCWATFQCHCRCGQELSLRTWQLRQ